MPRVTQAAFAVACFSGLLDVHECSGGLQMAAYPFDKQTAGCNSPHGWLVCLAMDLAALCDMWQVKIIPMDVIWLVLVKTEPLPATLWLSTHPSPSHPVGVLLLLATLVKKLSKMAGNLASYLLNSW